MTIEKPAGGRHDDNGKRHQRHRKAQRRHKTETTVLSRTATCSWRSIGALFGRYVQHAIHRPDQPLNVHVEILTRVDLDRIAISEILEAIRQVNGRRHGGAKYERRDQWDAFAQRRLNFHAHRVRLIVEPVSTFTSTHPSRPDNSRHDLALVEYGIDVLPEVDTEGDVVDIAKDGSAAIMSHESVEDTAADYPRVSATIRDGYSRHRALSFACTVRTQAQSASYRQVSPEGRFRRNPAT